MTDIDDDLRYLRKYCNEDVVSEIDRMPLVRALSYIWQLQREVKTWKESYEALEAMARELK